MLTTILIARFVAPSTFGQFSLWLGIVMIASVIVTARFETALAVEVDGHPRKLLLFGALVTVVVLSTLLGGVILLDGILGRTLFASTISNVGFALVGPAACLVALSQIAQSWFAAEGRYDALSKFRIVQASGISGLHLLTSLIEPTAENLALSYCLGVLIPLCQSVYSARNVSLPSKARILLAVCRLWTRHRRFVLYSLPADLLNTGSANLPLIVVASRFGPEAAGHLAMTMTMLGAPIALLGKSVLDVFKRQASSAFRMRGECRAEYRQTFFVLTVGSLFVLVVAVPTIKPVAVTLLGEHWRESADMALALLPLFLFRFVASPLSYLMYIAGRQDWDLLWQICLIAVVGVMLSVPERLDLVLFGYCFGYSLMYVIYLLLSYRLSGGALK